MIDFLLTYGLPALGCLAVIWTATYYHGKRVAMKHFAAGYLAETPAIAESAVTQLMQEGKHFEAAALLTGAAAKEEGAAAKEEGAAAKEEGAETHDLAVLFRTFWGQDVFNSRTDQLRKQAQRLRKEYGADLDLSYSPQLAEELTELQQRGEHLEAERQSEQHIPEQWLETWPMFVEALRFKQGEGDGRLREAVNDGDFWQGAAIVCAFVAKENGTDPSEERQVFEASWHSGNVMQAMQNFRGNHGGAE